MLAITASGKIWLAVVGGVFIVFALAVAMVIPRSRPDFPGKRLRLFLVLVAVLFAAMIATVWLTSGKEGETAGGGETVATETQPATTETQPATTETQPATTETPPATTEAGGGAAEGDAAAGKAVFASAGCSGCHTLKAAGASGAVGPNLDEKKPPLALVVDRVTHGKGVMPPFKGQLSEQQIADVAAFVSSSAGG